MIKLIYSLVLHPCRLCISRDRYVNKAEQKHQLPVLRRCGCLADVPELFSYIALHHIWEKEKVSAVTIAFYPKARVCAKSRVTQPAQVVGELWRERILSCSVQAAFSFLSVILSLYLIIYYPWKQLLCQLFLLFLSFITYVASVVLFFLVLFFFFLVFSMYSQLYPNNPV